MIPKERLDKNVEIFDFLKANDPSWNTVIFPSIQEALIKNWGNQNSGPNWREDLFTEMIIYMGLKATLLVTPGEEYTPTIDADTFEFNNFLDTISLEGKTLQEVQGELE